MTRYARNMRTVNRRELNQHSGRIIDDVVRTGEPVEVVTRGGQSVMISLVPRSRYEQWTQQGLVEPATTRLDQVSRASTTRSADDIRDAIDSDH